MKSSIFQGRIAAALLLVAGTVAAGTASAGTASADEELAFERTEERSRCAHYTVTRQPFFGQTHLHTQYSADAATISTRNTPRDAYRFARGEKVGLAPFYDTRLIRTSDDEPPVGGVSAHPYCLPPDRCQYTASRSIQMPEGRALDFAAVTDHSEFLGETNICYFEGGKPCDSQAAESVCSVDQTCSPNTGTCVPYGYDSPFCVTTRQAVNRLTNGLAAAIFVGAWQQWNPQNPPYGFCTSSTPNGEDSCARQAENVWQQIIAAAEEAYDRTDRCEFTSFIGYEYTSMPQLLQCSKSFGPCLADDDCKGGPTDRCLAPGQCSAPAGKLCFVDQAGACDTGGECIANGGGNNLHRNIIFRNANVPAAPISYFNVPTGCGAGEACRDYAGPENAVEDRGKYSTASGVSLGSPTVMLEALEGVCNPDDGCEFLSIPHNSNLSGGAMFLTPETPRDARVRAEHERLVEIFQIKGDSECRYSAQHPDAWQPGANVPDELCDFEDMRFATLAAGILVDPDARSVPASGYVRNALKHGLRYQKDSEAGVNPFKLGFVGSLDNHNGTPTATEVDYSKHGAHGTVSFGADGQMQNPSNFLGLETNGGGVSVVWAEENSRDSIFAAMQRRETYATSGTRPVVRFFGGFDLPETMCQRGDFAQQGYDLGVPMGGTLAVDARSSQSRRRTSAAGPRFAVSALMDLGWVGHPGTTLQRIQIIKGWVDADGEVREQVYDVAGSSEIAPVDLATCAPAPPESGGAASLCEVWQDPDFDPDLHAFYYARVLENPSCRWNQYYCLDRGVDCGKRPELGEDVVGYNAYDYEQCCSGEVPKAVQQRAWTSPIWYEPASDEGSR
ncbi:MAG: DUF3604 domain-containing protein [Acidobacteriota bacterium]